MRDLNSKIGKENVKTLANLDKVFVINAEKHKFKGTQQMIRYKPKPDFNNIQDIYGRKKQRKISDKLYRQCNCHYEIKECSFTLQNIANCRVIETATFQ